MSVWANFGAGLSFDQVHVALAYDVLSKMTVHTSLSFAKDVVERCCYAAYVLVPFASIHADFDAATIDILAYASVGVISSVDVRTSHAAVVQRSPCHRD